MDPLLGTYLTLGVLIAAGLYYVGAAQIRIGKGLPRQRLLELCAVTVLAWPGTLIVGMVANTRRGSIFLQRLIGATPRP